MSVSDVVVKYCHVSIVRHLERENSTINTQERIEESVVLDVVMTLVSVLSHRSTTHAA
jgi:hypothetical protein